jgi:hypothetical protein
MDLSSWNWDVIQQGLVRHSRIAARIVGWNTPFVSPEYMGLLPGNQLSEWFSG